jgi:putative endonuclease
MGTRTASTNKSLGLQGEQAACTYLEREGCEILERNWRCKQGEADIIMMDGDCLVFAEVKTRASTSAGMPEEAVTPAKRKKYENIAMYYLATHDIASCRVRFDIMAIVVFSNTKVFLKHYKNAFCVGE